MFCLILFFCGQYLSENFLVLLFCSENSSYGPLCVFIYAGAPASTVGWRDPGFIHTSFLKELWPNTKYVVSSIAYVLYEAF